MSAGRATAARLIIGFCLFLPVVPTAAAQTPATPKPGSHPAQPSAGLGLDFAKNESGKPVDIQADQGIEWQQNNQVYIARGNAKATRGSVSVQADTLTAHYRPVAQPAASAPQPAPPASPLPADAKHDSLGGSTEVYRVDADGNVRIASDTQTVFGGHAVYDIDKATLVVTGEGLKLVGPRDTVTAHDSLEWYDRDQIAVARGDAVAMRDQKRLRADTLTAQVTKDAKGAQRFSRIDAQGSVVVASADQTGSGDSGVYNVDTGIATLIGHVLLTRGENELRGQYAVVDLNHNVSRLLSAPPSATLTGTLPRRVEGLIMPRQKPAASPAQKSDAPKPATTNSDTSNPDTSNPDTPN